MNIASLGLDLFEIYVAILHRKHNFIAFGTDINLAQIVHWWTAFIESLTYLTKTAMNIWLQKLFASLYLQNFPKLKVR